MVRKGVTTGYLSPGEVEAVVTESLASLPLDGRRLLVIIPDRTRTMPLPLFFREIVQALLPRVKGLNFLVALGTHPPRSEADILNMVGLSPEDRASRYPAVGLFNHAW